MPYIADGQRNMFKTWLSMFRDIITFRYNMNYKHIEDGEMNYVITSLIQDWLGDDPHYTDYNSAIGVLECVKLELYRRKIAKYEDMKKKENGDVYL